MANHMNAPHKGQRNSKKVAALVAAIIVFVLLLVYLGGVVAFNMVFMPGTTLDGADVSLRPASEVAAEKSASFAGYETHVTGDGVDLTISADQIDLVYDGEAYAQEAIEATNPWAWPIALAQGTRSVTAESAVVFDQDALLALFDSFIGAAEERATSLGADAVAYDSETGAFSLDSGITARYLDNDALVETLTSAFSSLETEVVLDEAQLGDVDDDLHAAVDAANAYLGAAGTTLTLDGETAAEVTADDIAGWVSVADDYSVTLDEDAAAEWAQSCVSSLNTVGSERTYTRADGKEVSVSGGSYGWSVDTDGVASSLVEAVASGSPQTLEVSFSQRGAVVPDSGGRDWGNRYIDIDLSEQHVYMYDEDGSLIWESDCVTGDTSQGHDTPTGVYEMNSYRASGNVKLTGEIDPDTGEPEYISYVDYWMPFIGNLVALHDADWRSSFGGNIYTYNGSHGCVNLPVSKAKELFDLCEIGDVVVVHY